ncbi:unnamed protein product [Rhodiola kirilowii]
MPFMCSGSKSVSKSKSNVSQVNDPKAYGQFPTRTSINKSSNCPCSKLKARFKYGRTSKRHSEKPVLKILAGCATYLKDNVGTQKGKLGVPMPKSPTPRSFSIENDSMGTHVAFAEIDTNKFTCNRCGQLFVAPQDVEAHHLSQHAVTVLPEGGCTWSVIERICKPSFSESEPVRRWMQTVLKVNNLPKSMLQFEDYRLKVQTKANQLSNPHPKLLADGNELMRFHGTTVECSLLGKHYSTPCSSNTCSLCQILRFGLSCNEAPNARRQGIITTSSSGRALQLVDVTGGSHMLRKALVLCRVIAGRVYSPLDGQQEQLSPASMYDSLATSLGQNGNRQVYDELHLLNSAAVLPCFVIICKVSHKHSA